MDVNKASLKQHSCSKKVHRAKKSLSKSALLALPQLAYTRPVAGGRKSEWRIYALKPQYRRKPYPFKFWPAENYLCKKILSCLKKNCPLSRRPVHAYASSWPFVRQRQAINSATTAGHGQVQDIFWQTTSVENMRAKANALVL